ncbi:MAG: efflux RND transporter periplasmic adaptor subunit [Candidatus Omnitrophota bacterium]
MNVKTKTALYIFLLLSLCVSAGCTKAKSAAVEKEVIPVKGIRVEFRDLDEAIDYVGNIKAQDEAMVYPKVSGKIIEKVREDGSFVVKGEVIAYIDRDEVGFKFEKAPVESPLSGVIGRVAMDIGSQVTPQTAIALVVDMSKVKIDLDIPEKYLSRISLGQDATISVDAYPQEKFSGKVSKISPVVDLSTRTAPIEITVDNPKQQLKSGMFARVSLILEHRKDVPVILKEAIMGKEPSLYVYTIEDNRAMLKKIKLGIRQGPYFEVKEGLKEGDTVVTMGQQKLYENAAVAVETEKQ